LLTVTLNNAVCYRARQLLVVSVQIHLVTIFLLKLSFKLVFFFGQNLNRTPKYGSNQSSD